MAEAIGFHSPAVYVPQSNIIPPKLFEKINQEETAATPDTGQTADPTTAAQVPVVGTLSENFDRSNRGSEEPLLPDLSAQFLAQELGGTDRLAEPPPPIEIRAFSLLPSPSVLVGTPEALARFDSDTDGHINQSDAQRAVLAESGSTTYSALTQYQRALGLAPEPAIPIPTGPSFSVTA
jgi:hypothetical protein